MLHALTLKDFVIADAVEVVLGGGFTALTGETGAGKSILIDALQLALGERAEAGVVREGAARAEIAVSFECPPALAQLLQTRGFEPGDDHELLLRRVIEAGGRSRSFINGGAATLAQMRDIAAHVVDIHGQHAWQSLTDVAGVRALVDNFAGAQQAAAATRQAYADVRTAQTALEQAQRLSEERRERRERLQWQIAEIDKVAPQIDEWATLNEEHSRLGHAQALIDATVQAASLLDGSDGAARDGVLAALHRINAMLQDVVHHDAVRLEPTVAQITEAQALLADAARDLSAYAARVDVDGARLAQIDERVAAWLGLARRFKVEAADLAGQLARWQTELTELDAQSDLDAMRAALVQAHQQWQQQAERLSAQRRAGAPALAERVTALMQTLGMEGGRLELDWQVLETPQAHGLETVQLLVAAHAGSTPRPLAKVASGGELSRLALAIAIAALPDTGEPATEADGQAALPTLIFDEVDAGIGGVVAERVGQLLRQLGQRAQVLAITHLPQVAAAAHAHWVVRKHTSNGVTVSQLAMVEGQTREQEIARMLGGQKTSGVRLAHAQELLQHAATQLAR